MSTKPRATSVMIQCLEPRRLLSVTHADVIGPIDSIPPAASIVPPAVVTQYGSVRETIEVFYADNADVNIYSITPANLTVTGPGGPLAITGVATNPSVYAKTIIADYIVAAPTGGWNSSDNGTYIVQLLGSTQRTGTAKVPNAAADTSGNSVPAESSSFTVNVPPAPVASIATPGNITSQTSAPETITVTYTDANAVNAGSITPADLSVSGPGGQAIAVTAVSLAPNGNASSITATYAIAPPGNAGAWVAGDNGTYSVALLANQVTNVGGVPAASVATRFTVNVPVPPVAAIAAPAQITGIIAAPQTVVVTYTDANAVDANSIGIANLNVSAPGGQSLIITGVSVTPPGNAGTITATYTVAPPASSGNIWEPADDGIYTVTLLSNQVKNVGGAPANSVTSHFAVDIPVPPSAVDTGFAGGGTVSSGFVAESAAVQPDGRIVLAGRIGDIAAGSSQAIVERINANGSIDTTFGNGGRVTSAAGANGADYALALEPDGSIVTAGTRDGSFAVERYLANGASDPSFGSGGRVVTSFGGAAGAAYSVAVAPDGSIVAGGSSNGSFAFVRYLHDGSLDTFFGQRGIALFGMGSSGTSNVIGGLALEPDGSIVAAGASGTSVALVRLTADGQEDPSFGSGGAMIVPQLQTPSNLTAPDTVAGVAIGPDGRILVANTSAAGHFAIARVNTNGSVDTSFGMGGIATANFGGNDAADAVIAQPTGEILAVGTTDAGATPQIAVAAFGRDGTLDPSFGTGGMLTFPAGISAAPGSLGAQAIHVGDLFLHAFGAVGANGKLVVGSTNDASAADTSSGLRRLNVPGAGLVGSFGPIGAVGGKNRKLTFIDNNGVTVTLSLKGAGAGQAFFDGNAIDLVLSGTGASTVVTIKGRGGHGQVDVRNVQADGALKAFSAGTTLLSGSFSAGGNVGAISLLGLTGTIGTAGSIGSVSIGKQGLTNASILAGTNLGSDGQLGGSGTAADSFAAASIGKLKIAGAVAGSIIAAGLNPAGGVLLSPNDTVIGGAASRIGAISIHGGVDESSRFIAGAFGAVAIPKKVKDLGADSRFEVL